MTTMKPRLLFVECINYVDACIELQGQSGIVNALPRESVGYLLALLYLLNKTHFLVKFVNKLLPKYNKILVFKTY